MTALYLQVLLCPPCVYHKDQWTLMMSLLWSQFPEDDGKKICSDIMSSNLWRHRGERSLLLHNVANLLWHKSGHNLGFSLQTSEGSGTVRSHLPEEFALKVFIQKRDFLAIQSSQFCRYFSEANGVSRWWKVLFFFAWVSTPCHWAKYVRMDKWTHDDGISFNRCRIGGLCPLSFNQALTKSWKIIPTHVRT